MTEYEAEQERRNPVIGIGLALQCTYNEQTSIIEPSNLSLVRQRLRQKDANQIIPIHNVEAPSWPSGTRVHVLLRFEANPGLCTFVCAYRMRSEAEQAFADAESGLWERLRNLSGSSSKKNYCVVKVDQWSCDFLECTDRGGWRRPTQGADAWFLRTVVLEY